MDKKSIGLTGEMIRIIAMATMLIDHIIGYILVAYLHNINGADYNVNSNVLYIIGRGIGRIAYPLFLFMIAEGAYYSKNRVKYALKILVFAVVSIPCKNLVTNGNIFDFAYFNVMFGLLAGLLCVMAVDYINEHLNGKRILAIIIDVVLVLGVSACMEICAVEYSICSTLTIVTLYYTRKLMISRGKEWIQVRNAQIIAGGVAFFLSIFIKYIFLIIGYYGFQLDARQVIDMAFQGTYKGEGMAIAAFIILFFYNGLEGRRLPKLFLYVFYPVHLLIIGLILLLFK